MSNAELFADMGFDAIFLSASHDYEEPHIWVPDPFNLRQGIFSHVLDQSYSSELEDLQKCYICYQRSKLRPPIPAGHADGCFAQARALAEGRAL